MGNSGKWKLIEENEIKLWIYFSNLMKLLELLSHCDSRWKTPWKSGKWKQHRLHSQDWKRSCTHCTNCLPASGKVILIIIIIFNVECGRISLNLWRIKLVTRWRKKNRILNSFIVYLHKLTDDPIHFAVWTIIIQANILIWNIFEFIIWSATECKDFR